MSQFLHIWNCVRELIIQRLLVTPAQERARTVYMDSIKERNASHLQDIEKFKNEKEEIERSSFDVINASEEELASLQHKIHEIVSFLSNEIEHKWKSYRQSLDYERKQREYHYNELSEKLEQKRLEYKEVKDEHYREESDWRARKTSLENEVDRVIKNYDKECFERHEKWIHMNKQLHEDKRRLEKYEDGIVKNEIVYNEILRVRKAKEMEVERQRKETLRRHAAAIIIQRNWRLYLDRVPPNMRQYVLRKKTKAKKGKGKK